MLNRRYYIGIMSGTSVDAIDIALVNINTSKIEFIAGKAFDFSAQLREKILNLCKKQHTSLVELGELTHQLSIAYATAVNTFLALQHINADQIVAIGCHGQTVFHQPNGDHPFSMQLVNAAVIAAETAITTVTDFRSMDIALGGQGAPLVPLFHQAIVQENHFKQLDAAQSLVFLNIGGISNISIVQPKPLVGFDTGPGNVLLDAWIFKALGKRYDADGAFAAKGQCNDGFLQLLLSEPYFTLPAPKSSGRELFNLPWLELKISEYWQNQKIKDEDIMATLVQLTCLPIIESVKHLSSGQLLVCGGGVKNHSIMACLSDKLPHWQVISTDVVGISSDFMEAMAFAWLAYRSINRLAGNDPKVTGASRHEVCGSITQILSHPVTYV